MVAVRKKTHRSAASKTSARRAEGDLVDRKMATWSQALERSDLTGFEICIRLQRLSLLAGLPLNDVLRPVKLVPGDADVIATLFETGSPYALTPGRLAELCFVTTGAMTGRIDRLERAGMVSRLRSATDRRSQEVRLTKKGADLAITIGHSAQDAQFVNTVRSLPRADLQNLLRILKDLERRASK